MGLSASVIELYLRLLADSFPDWNPDMLLLVVPHSLYHQKYHMADWQKRESKLKPHSIRNENISQSLTRVVADIRFQLAF